MEEAFHEVSYQKALLAFVKSALVAMVYTFALGGMVVIVLVDIVFSVILRTEFPIIMFLYEKVYQGFTMAWYWEALSGNDILMGVMIMFLVGFIYLNIRPLRKKEVVVFDPRRVKPGDTAQVHGNDKGYRNNKV